MFLFIKLTSLFMRLFVKTIAKCSFPVFSAQFHDESFIFSLRHIHGVNCCKLILINKSFIKQNEVFKCYRNVWCWLIMFW